MTPAEKVEAARIEASRARWAFVLTNSEADRLARIAAEEAYADAKREYDRGAR